VVINNCAYIKNQMKGLTVNVRLMKIPPQGFDSNTSIKPNKPITLAEAIEMTTNNSNKTKAREDTFVLSSK